LIILIACIKLWAQTPLVKHFTTSEGLPSNGVHKVFLDSKKFIWFATDAGVSRYDGSKFNYFRKQDGLSSNEVFEIKEDSFGRIWFFHANATLDFFYNNSIHNENNTPFLDSLKCDDYFSRFLEDEQRNIHFYSQQNRLIYTLDPQNQVSKYELPTIPVLNPITLGRAEGLSVRFMNKDEKVDLLIWALGCFFKMKQKLDTPVFYYNKYRFKDVITSSSGKKYILVCEKDSLNFEIKRFNQEIAFDKIEPLVNTGSNFVTSILEDENGYLWISTTDQGVYCYKENKLFYYFEIKGATSIIQDHEKNIWISSLKEGVFKISPLFYTQEHFDTDMFKNSGIYAMDQDDSFGIWCTNGELIYLLRDNTIYKVDFQRNEKSFDQLLHVRSNILLIGEIGKKPYILEGLSINESAKKVTIDKVQLSPVVTNKLLFNPHKNEISSFFHSYLIFTRPDRPFKQSSIKRMGERVFNCYYNNKNELIYNGSKNYIYYGGRRHELEELSPFNKKVISDHLNLNDQTELFNIEGYSLILLNAKRLYNLSAEFDQPVDLAIKHLVYKDSTLFIATSKNLYLCKNPLNILQKQPVELNLIDINFNSIHEILINDSKLYIASDDGLTALPYNELKSSIVSSPIPHFNSIQVNDQENLVPQHSIALYTNQRVNISFGCINYSVSPNIFSYKLEGSDVEWIEARGTNVVLQNLPKGKYSFQLRARKPASAWGDTISFGITVQAPIWQHPLFYFFAVLVIAVIIFLIVLRQKNIELARRQMENQIILLEQKSQQAMMNPHFIFNVLGSIQNYLLRNQPNEAGIYLSQFARLIRQNLKATNSSMINLQEEIDRLKDYLDLEKLRMGDKFEYSIEIADSVEVEDVFVPAMIVQPFVENAVWHGISQLDGNGFIGISFEMKDEKSLTIIVEDNGIGLRNAEKNGNRTDSHLKLGTGIIRKRLDLLSKKYETETQITYSEKSPGSSNPGTRVVIIVPFLYGQSET